MPIKAAVMGLGNIGRYAIEALEIQPDFTCVGVIRRKESLGKDAHDLRGVPEYASLADLEAVSGKPDVVLLCAPSRKIPEVAGDLLGRGYNTVDSFDIHDRIVETIGLLEAQGGGIHRPSKGLVCGVKTHVENLDNLSLALD